MNSKLTFYGYNIDNKPTLFPGPAFKVNKEERYVLVFVGELCFSLHRTGKKLACLSISEDSRTLDYLKTTRVWIPFEERNDIKKFKRWWNKAEKLEKVSK